MGALTIALMPLLSGTYICELAKGKRNHCTKAQIKILQKAQSSEYQGLRSPISADNLEALNVG